MLQIEYHYYRSEMTQPSTMLKVLKGLEARNVRVFHTEVAWTMLWPPMFYTMSTAQASRCS